MPAGCRRVSFAALALMAGALASFAASPATAAASTAEAATDPVSITVKVGYSGFVKPEQWMPLAIDLTNTGPGVDGTPEGHPAAFANGPPITPAIYTTHVGLAPAAPHHLKPYLTA